MKKLRLCTKMNLHGEPGEDFNEYIKKGVLFHKNAGFDALDFPFAKVNYSDGNWRKIIDTAISESEKAGIRFEVGHLPYSSKIAKDESLLPQFNKNMFCAIEAAAQLGVAYADFHPNTTTLRMENYDAARERERVLSHLSPFVDYAVKLGVKVVVENMRYVPKPTPAHRYCQTPEELCDIADTLGIGVCWDFGHSNINAQKQSEAIAYVGSRLKVLHVNDNNGVGDDHVPPFCGKVDWRDAMHGLALIGFEGLFNYELHTSKVPESMSEHFASYVRAAAYELMSYI